MCIKCFGHFHLSCLERRKSVKITEGGNCLCSVECQKSYKREEEENILQRKKLQQYTEKIQMLEEKIIQVEEEREIKEKDLIKKMDTMSLLNIEKEHQIRTLRRHSETFENDVFLSESEYEERLKNLEESERKSKKLVKNLECKIANKQEELNCSENVVKDLREEVKNLKKENENLVSMVETLNKENEEEKDKIKIITEENRILKEKIEELKKEQQNSAKKISHNEDGKESQKKGNADENEISDEVFTKLESKLFSRLLVQIKESLISETEPKMKPSKEHHATDINRKTRKDSKTLKYSDVIMKNVVSRDGNSTERDNSKDVSTIPKIIIDEFKEPTQPTRKNTPQKDRLSSEHIQHEVWTTVEAKKRKTKKQNVIEGNSDITSLPENASFTSAERKAWLYVGRVDLKATECNIKNFLTRKFPNREFRVEMLPKRENAISIAFKVAADFSLMEELQKPEMWPQGVLVRRFRFLGRGQSFQSGE